MYHEGWWGGVWNKAAYLIPGSLCLMLTLLAIRWPRAGGWVIIVLGAAFTLLLMDIQWVDGHLSLDRDFAGFFISLPFVLVGILFLLEARYRARRRRLGWQPHPKCWRRNLAYLLSMIPTALIFVGVSAYYLPIILTRQDDGQRGERLIAGNGPSLIWAPAGPGWNWQQDFGGYPSWHRIALYGLPPVGMDDKPGFISRQGQFASAAEMQQYNLCLYLSADGLTLMDTPQHIWRMPTVDELVAALAQHGENAGCTWNGEPKTQLDCARLPDKETPLWAPDLPPIYYWAADEASARNGYFVSYNGWVNATYKPGGNPRHSYRCVREP